MSDESEKWRMACRELFAWCKPPFPESMTDSDKGIELARMKMSEILSGHGLSLDPPDEETKACEHFYPPNDASIHDWIKYKCIHCGESKP